MSRLTDILEAIPLCEAYMDGVDDGCSACPYNGRCKDLVPDTIKMLEDLAKRVPRWNSVKENPPREGECVFCYYPYKAYGSKIMVDYNQAGEGATPHFSNQALWGRCTHWMPLHELPEEKKEDDHE